jgi:proteasome assembly chaperone (PAC2) family protein
MKPLGEEKRKEGTNSRHKVVMLVGMSGWGNAGEVSTYIIKYLVDTLKAERFSEISPEQYHDYLIQRPTVSIEQGVIQSYSPPRNELFYWHNHKGRDVILLLGYEPNLRWPKYAETILKLAKEKSVERIYTIGAYLADVSHEDETPITATTNKKEVITELKKVGVRLANYKGPTSIYSELLWQGKEKKNEVVSLWCAVPIYIRGLYPKAIHHILTKLVQLTGLKFDLKQLEEKTKAFQSRFYKEAGGLTKTLRRSKEREPTYIY